MRKEILIKEILIVVKTYPTRSKKYTELVCTAGIDKEGNWYRIYPIPTKTLKEYEGLQKYTWIKAEFTKDPSDPRPESHKINTSSIETLETIPTTKDWQYRKDIFFKTKIYKNMDEIINLAREQNQLSLCSFKPTKFVNVYFESKEVDELNKKEYQNTNANLFEHKSACEVEFNAMPQVPLHIKLVFEDDSSKQSKMNILDWEISQLYWNLQKSGKIDKEIKQDIKDKLFWMIKDRDLYLILGTMRQMHDWTSNPFTIIGLFYPPKNKPYAPSLFG